MEKETIKTSVEKVFNQMPDTFLANNLIARVRTRRNQPYLRDESIMRFLRQLRQEMIIYYKPEQKGVGKYIYKK